VPSRLASPKPSRLDPLKLAKWGVKETGGGGLPNHWAGRLPESNQDAKRRSLAFNNSTEFAYSIALYQSTARRYVYNPQTGRVGGRAAQAMPRLDELTKKYIDEGLPADQARDRARAELRVHNRGDWRGGSQDRCRANAMMRGLLIASTKF
jgi:hypothetical protein